MVQYEEILFFSGELLVTTQIGLKNKFKISMVLTLIFLGLIFVFGAKDFGKVLACEQITDKQLCSKIGQMLIVGFGGFDQEQNGNILWNDVDGTQFNKNSLIARHIADNNIGGVILFTKPSRDIRTGEFIRDRNIQTPAQVAKLNKELQTYNEQIRKAQNLETLPLFISVDQEGGSIDRLPATLGFPVRTLLPQALGAKEEMWIDGGDCAADTFKKSALQETYMYAKRLADEISVANFNLNFAPVVDVNINPTSLIIGGLGRSFSSNPEVVVDQARLFIRAFNDYKIIPALKHFPGHGSSSGDSHLGLVDVTESYRKNDELYPYRKLIKEGYDGIIMTTHVINGQIDKTQCKAGSKADSSTWCPGTMSEKTLTDLLRGEMGFKGLIVSDDMTMGAIADQYSIREAFKRAINAGVDLFIIANNKADQTELVINTIAQLVKEGEIQQKKIEDAYDRISKFKREKIISGYKK